MIQEIFKKILLVLGSIVCCLIIIEIFLIFNKTYYNQVYSDLTPSETLFERPKNSTYRNIHPDTKEIIEIRYDSSGIRNFDKIDTKSKKNIIAFFGDSFTENISIKNGKTFIDLLQANLRNYSLVNYGVGNFALDQIIIRYLKFKSHDIKKVYYIFCSNDADFLDRNLIVFNNDNYEIKKHESSKIIKFLGYFHTTYLIIDSYYTIRSIFFKKYTQIDKINYPKFLASKYFRITNNFENTNIENNKKKFLQYLYFFKKIVEQDNRTFAIIVLPLKNENKAFNFLIEDQNYFNVINLFKMSNDNNKVFKEESLKFKNDGHLNEEGQTHMYMLLKNKIL